ncbi:unnamed protein product [Penicillium salamii]|nr:unnamed protein product [Penicillium salamii]CAG8426701.1 unnamed protein product [Penicillium salamii]
MHHYSVFTAKAFSDTFDEAVVNALQVDVPRLALEHAFLIDAVLFAAMVHLGCSSKSAISLPLFTYRDQALRTLRTAVENLSSTNIHAVRGASVLLAAVSFPTDRITNQSGLWISNWMALALGQRNFRANRIVESSTPGDAISTAGLYGSFSDLDAAAVIPIPIRCALEETHGVEETQDSAYHSTLSTAAAELGRLISILKNPYETMFLEKKVKAWTFDVVQPEFLSFIQKGRPKALVVLAYYLALFKFVPKTWIYQGFPDHDIAIVTSTLGPIWKKHVSIPQKIIQMDDDTVAAKLLVSCLENADII